MMNLNEQQRAALKEYRNAKAQKDTSILDAATLGLKKRAAGVMQTGLKGARSLGVESADPLLDDVTDLLKDYEKQGQGTGVKGFVGEVLGDPLTYLPMGKAVNLMRNLLLQGGISGATRGDLSDDKSLSSNLEQALIEAGGSAAMGKFTQKLLKPISGEVDDVAKKSIKTLQDEGINLTTAQQTGSRGLGLMEEGFKDLPLTAGKASRQIENQLEEFTSAALSKAGIKAKRATPEVLKEAQAVFDKRYSNIVDKISAKVDDELLGDLAILDAEARKRFGKGARQITSYIDDILESNGKISGEVFQNTRNELGKLQRSNDTLVGHLAGKLKKALDKSIDSQIPKSLASERNALNKEYGAFLQINKALSTTTEEAASGLITPAKLLGAAKIGNKRFAQGSGEVLDLARAGRDVISSKVPDSGTPKRQMMNAFLTGGAAAGLSGDPMTGALFVGLPKAIQEIYGTKLAEQYLKQGITSSVVPAVAAGRLAKEAASPEMPKAKKQSLNDKQIEALKEFRAKKSTQTKDSVSITPLSNTFDEEQMPVDVPTYQQANASSPFDVLNMRGEMPETERGYKQSAFDVLKKQQKEFETKKTAGTNSPYFERLAMVESSNNYSAKAPTSSAYGRYQITGGTAKGLIDKYGKTLGVDSTNWTKPQNQEKLARKLTEENRMMLRDFLNRDPSQGELYIAHFAGYNGARKLLNKANSSKKAASVLPDAAKANQTIFYDGEQKNGKFIPKRARSVREVREILKSKMEG
jgi:hypothetical protein